MSQNYNMEIEIEISDLLIEIINLDTNEFNLTRCECSNTIHLSHNRNSLSQSVALKYIEILIFDMTKNEDEYRRKYPVIFRKYKINKIIDEIST